MKTAIATITLALLATGCATQTQPQSPLSTFKGVSYERAVAAADLKECRTLLDKPYRTADEEHPVEMPSSYIAQIAAKRAIDDAERAIVRSCMAAKGHTELVVVAVK